MRLAERILLSLVAAIVSGAVGGAATFILVLWTDTCVQDSQNLCDVAPVAGVGLGFLVGLLLAIIAGTLSFRKLSRRASSIGSAAL